MKKFVKRSIFFHKNIDEMNNLIDKDRFYRICFKKCRDINFTLLENLLGFMIIQCMKNFQKHKKHSMFLLQNTKKTGLYVNIFHDLVLSETYKKISKVPEKY
ncbi:hypothetical protein SU69_08370 [Thermosipho melanesiensis]|uniref:Uncharacterized protein n=1 Tax=Thermosipho melanesiensis TaxID=46541 RepID=A0ABM6GHC5_9BACT|nr:hypothetical protein [Thermosipho melanesiensis]APT74930.1 hypothetical protein BW47_08730 [Thermosipho melanesiensis]OOC36501.1 hypothetical protein SU68_08440 [Thermosipho melanesiensis]OOC37319.1 hypothetical protein SU69_08370 [Thermosipho melanesiensis]OOC38072.1 hypothetical protein SU70_08380 [Thermosipho melanesiensis]OOC41299.1 hypothetical protein SU71_08365 [Thermosipho melanesiensis]